MIGLLLGGLAGAMIFGKKASSSLPIAETGIGSVAAGPDDESTLFIKLPAGSLTAFEPGLQTTGQVTTVEVRGYDDGHKKEIVGSATASEVGGSDETPSHIKVGGHSKNNPDKIANVEVEMYVENIHTKFG